MYAFLSQFEYLPKTLAKPVNKSQKWISNSLSLILPILLNYTPVSQPKKCSDFLIYFQAFGNSQVAQPKHLGPLLSPFWNFFFQGNYATARKQLSNMAHYINTPINCTDSLWYRRLGHFWLSHDKNECQRKMSQNLLTWTNISLGLTYDRRWNARVSLFANRANAFVKFSYLGYFIHGQFFGTKCQFG